MIDTDIIANQEALKYLKSLRGTVEQRPMMSDRELAELERMKELVLEVYTAGFKAGVKGKT
jgi:hypothetical protein